MKKVGASVSIIWMFMVLLSALLVFSCTGTQSKSGPPPAVDVDGDGIPDKEDNCPSRAGWNNPPDICEEDFQEEAEIVPGRRPFVQSGSKKFIARTSRGRVQDPAFRVKFKPVNPHRNQQYVIRPRCDNINLELVCNDKKVPNTCLLLGPVVLGCPEENDPIVDVVRPLPLNEFETQCSLSDHFNLEAIEGAVGEAISCVISGTYATQGFKDPRGPNAGAKPGSTGPQNVCETDKGRIPLITVQQKIPPHRLTLERTQ